MKQFVQIVFIFAYVNSYAQTPIFYGGAGDGHVSACLTQNYYNGASIFVGGSFDGAEADCEIQIAKESIYNGGSDDGFSIACYEEDVIPVFGLYTGGENDGSSFLCYTQNPEIGSQLFYGGINDGFSFKCYLQNQTSAADIYYGGFDDGSANNCFVQDVSPGSDIYFGSNEDGFAYSCFEQDISVVYGTYTGGSGDGFSKDCFLQDDYLIALPIELVSFEAIAVAEKRMVLLKWETASEFNNDYFIVERSLDGVNWEAVSKIKGAGTSSNTNNYNVHDVTPYPGYSYYRLKQVDYDGNFTYSLIRSVDLNSNSQIENELLIYPNPATSLLNFQFDNFKQNALKVFFFDLSGKLVLEESVELENGQGLYTVNFLYMLQAGTYIVVVSDGIDLNLKQKIVIN